MKKQIKYTDFINFLKDKDEHVLFLDHFTVTPKQMAKFEILYSELKFYDEYKDDPLNSEVHW